MLSSPYLHALCRHCWRHGLRGARVARWQDPSRELVGASQHFGHFRILAYDCNECGEIFLCEFSPPCRFAYQPRAFACGDFVHNGVLQPLGFDGCRHYGS